MTYKYYDVRREIYESCSDKKLKGFRSWSEIKELFNTFHWAMLIVTILLLVSAIVIYLLPVNYFWCLIPMILYIPCEIMMELKFDSLLNKQARNNEIEKQNNAYKEYIALIQSVLRNNGIDTVLKHNLLKNECESVLKKYEAKYAFVNNRAFDYLIGVPIGALISSLIHQESDTLLNVIIAVIFVGILLIGIVKIVKRIAFYKDGYFKDKQLLDALQEVEYSLK